MRTGSTGSTGDTGFTGATGFTGSTGFTGDTGLMKLQADELKTFSRGTSKACSEECHRHQSVIIQDVCYHTGESLCSTYVQSD